eukprot:scaffold5939_cov111-Cylindrotheca_fusiformis.AAC.2
MEAATPTAAAYLRGWRKGGNWSDSMYHHNTELYRKSGEKKQNAKEKAYGIMAVVASHERASGGAWVVHDDLAINHRIIVKQPQPCHD